jgi:hypothetical protein
MFTNKAEIPDNRMLSKAIGDMFNVWMKMREYVPTIYPYQLKHGITPAKIMAGVSG